VRTFSHARTYPVADPPANRQGRPAGGRYDSYRRPTASDRVGEVAPAHLDPTRPEQVPTGGGLRLVSRPARVGRWRLIALVVAVVAVLFAVVGTNVVLTSGQFRLARLQSEETALANRHLQLELQVAQLDAPGRVMSTAEGKLGLVEPNSITYLDPSGKSTPVVSETQPNGQAPPGLPTSNG
jgi:cell division protein FtsL